MRLSTAAAGGGNAMSSVLKSAGQPKQIILQKPGSGGQPQIVTLVKTSQGMQVATVRSDIGRGRPARRATEEVVERWAAQRGGELSSWELHKYY